MTNTDTYNATLTEEDFEPLLLHHDIAYAKHSIFYQVGTPSKDDVVLFVSIVYFQVSDFLRIFLPLAKKEDLFFKLAQSDLAAKQILDGEYGGENVGKVITIYLSKEQLSSGLISTLASITLKFIGPRIPHTYPIGGCLYSKANIHENDKNAQPVNIDEIELPEAYKNAVIVVRNPKGNTVRAELHGTAGKIIPCFIKAARCNMWYDKTRKRCMYHKLIWQKEMLLLLQSKLNLPVFIDFFEINGNAYLVTQEISGSSMLKIINDANKNFSTWAWWGKAERKQIVHALLLMLEQIEQLHQLGYLHRDITPGNFILSNDGKLYIVDTELFYAIHEQLPNPAFDYGTDGFVSPNQQAEGMPEIADENFSAGATMLMSFTGLHPAMLNIYQQDGLFDRINYLIGNKTISTLIVGCLHPHPHERPSISTIKKVLEQESSRLINAGELEHHTAILSSAAIRQAIEDALHTLPYRMLAEPDISDTLNLKKEHTGGADWNGLLNGNLGAAYTIIRAFKNGYSIPVEPVQVGQFLMAQYKWHNQHFDDCEKGLINGMIGLAVVMMEAIDAGMFQVSPAIREFMIKCFEAESCNPADEKIYYEQVVALQYCINCKVDGELSGYAHLKLKKLADKIRERSVLLHQANDQSHSHFMLIRAVLAIAPYISDADFQNTVTFIKKLLAEKMSNTLYEIKTYGLAYKEGTVLNNLVKLTKIMLFSHVRFDHEYLIHQLWQLYQSIPERMVHNDYALQTGLCFAGAAYLQLYLQTGRNTWKIRADHIVAFIVLSQKKGHWIVGTANRNAAGILNGNSGIIHFLMDSMGDETMYQGFIL